MTIITRGQKVRSVIAKTIVVTLLSAMAFTLGIGTIVFMQTVVNPKPDSITKISGDFARKYGVTEFNREKSEPIPGLESTTATFTIEETEETTISKAVEYIVKNFGYFTDDQIVNLVVKAKSADGKKTYNLEFYSASADDLKNDTLEQIVSATNKLYQDETTRNITTISKPTLEGKRSTDFTTNILTEKFDSLIMQASWGKTVNAVTTALPLDGSLYNIKLDTDNGNGMNIIFTSFFYDEPTLATTNGLELKTFKSAETYATSGDFSFLPIKNVQFNQSLNPADSNMNIILNGNGEGTDTNVMSQTFTDAASKNTNAQFPTNYLTTLRFADQPNAFWTAYPQ
jgi:hypothetical protein